MKRRFYIDALILYARRQGLEKGRDHYLLYLEVFRLGLKRIST